MICYPEERKRLCRLLLGLAPCGIVLSLPAIPAVTDPPTINSIEPVQGYVDEETDLEVLGQGFRPPCGATLLGGGPVMTGSLSFPDFVYDVAYVDGYAFVSGGTTYLHVVDVRDPAHPTVVLDYPVSPGQTAWASDVAVSGGFAFVAAGWCCVAIFDVRQPEVREVVHLFYSPGAATDIAVSGDRAFIAAGAEGLIVADVSDPTRPVQIGHLRTPGGARAVAVVGDLAYVAGGSHGLQIIDTGDPSELRIVGDFDTTGLARGVAVADGLAYVVHDTSTFDQNPSLQIIDVKDPAAPNFLSRYDVIAYDVEVAGGRAYLSTWWGKLDVLDVSDPAKPRFLGSYHSAGHLYGRAVALDGGRAYLAVGNQHAEQSQTLHVVDITGTAPGRTRRCATAGYASDVAAADRYVYVADRRVGGTGPGFHVIDVEAPEEACLVASLDIEGWILDVSNGHAFLADDGLRIVDIADPFAPTVVGEVGLKGFARDAAVGGDRVYVTTDVFGCLDGLPNEESPGPRTDCWAGGLTVIDVSDPTRPVITARLEGAELRLGHVAVVGDHVYVGRSIVDVADPAAPTIVGEMAVRGPIRGLAVSGDNVYVLNDAARFFVLDAEEPSHPVVIATYDLPRQARAIAVRDGSAFVLDDADVLVFDVSDPATPVLVSSHATVGGNGLAVSETRIFVAAGRFGLEALRRNPIPEDVVCPTGTAMQLTVPAGFNPGSYDVRVTNPDGQTATAHNGYRVCDRRQLHAALLPSGRMGPFLGRGGVQPWKIAVDGDDAFFGSQPRHTAILRMPALPTQLTQEYVLDDRPGRAVIELRIDRGQDSGLLRLIGDDADRLTAIWEAARDRGGFRLPRLDRFTYGNLILEVAAGAGRLQLRYSLTDGLLSAAHATGPDVALEFEVTAVDPIGCPTREDVMFP